MKPERWVFGGLGLFYCVMTPVYWFSAHEVAGTWVLGLSAAMALMVFFYVHCEEYQSPSLRREGRRGCRWCRTGRLLPTTEYLAVLVCACCRHHVPRPDLRLVDLSARAGHWDLGCLGLGF